MAAPEQLADFSVDPNVRIPKHISDAAAAAEAIHAAAYPAEHPINQEDQQVQPEVTPAVETPAEPQPEPQPAAPVTAAVNPDDFTGQPTSQDMKDSVWAGRYNSMFGRYQNLQRQVGAMEEQMRALAGELNAAQGMLEQYQQRAPAAQAAPHHEQLITDADREAYGNELIDLTQRAAREAVAPQLDALRAENEQLKKRVTTTAQAEVKASLAARIPNWIEINRSPQFNAWLSLPNVYTGDIRGKSLKEAYRSGNAQRVIAIFEDFIKEVRATGAELPATPQPQATAQPQPPARQAAVALETLAAPGRARPSGGGDPAHQNADKPTYTRAQIANNYANKRRGAYAGRDAEWMALEADMIAAGNEGRVR